MKITVESTSKIVDLVVNGETIQCRIWQGHTESGIPMHAIIARVAVHKDEDASQFERELKEQAVPRAELVAYPLRMII